MKTLNYTHLEEKGANTIVLSLQQLLADFQIHYANLRGFHWNIKGHGFFVLHSKFEDLYNGAAEKVDEIAERILMLGGTPANKYSDYLKMAQIKELYKDSWETIPGNSDTLLYLGGNEASTHKYISEALGKSTIDTKTHGQTKGRSGSYSTNFQMSGRELLTPDEVRMLDNRYCILFIRGTRPVMDEKYELMEHPAIRYTMDGGGPPYIHHGTAEPPITGEPLFQTDFDNEKENAAA